MEIAGGRLDRRSARCDDQRRAALRPGCGIHRAIGVETIHILVETAAAEAARSATAGDALIVLKRYESRFAKIDNELFFRPSLMALFGDARATLSQLVRALRES